MGSAPTALQWLNLLINILLPMVVAGITARTADGWAKAVTLLILSAVSGFGLSVIEAYNAGMPPDLGKSAWVALVGLIVAIGTHFGLWKPGGLTGSAGLIQTRMPGGFGGQS
jgi:hypothetical protein